MSRKARDIQGVAVSHSPAETKTANSNNRPKKFFRSATAIIVASIITAGITYTGIKSSEVVAKAQLEAQYKKNAAEQQLKVVELLVLYPKERKAIIELMVSIDSDFAEELGKHLKNVGVFSEKIRNKFLNIDQDANKKIAGFIDESISRTLREEKKRFFREAAEIQFQSNQRELLEIALINYRKILRLDPNDKDAIEKSGQIYKKLNSIKK